MRKFALAFACAVLVGCVKINSTPLGLPMENRGVIAPAQVAIYRTADQVIGKYREVALLNATGSTTWTNESGMHRKMQSEAGKMGANGIILDAMSEPGTGAKVAGAIFGVDVERKGRAIAIYVYPTSAVPGQGSVAPHEIGGRAFPQGAAAMLTFEDGSTLFAMALTPSGHSDLRVTLMDGTDRFVGVHKVTSITDSTGADRTASVIDGRRSLPR